MMVVAMVMHPGKRRRQRKVKTCKHLLAQVVPSRLLNHPYNHLAAISTTTCLS